MRGLSPRVRGKPHRWPATVPARRSIPACAGETGPNGQCPLLTRVYPRVCGGNAQVTAQLRVVEGLSPRVRGKLSTSTFGTIPPWSIPACAGETRSGPAGPSVVGVYPRVCGGNSVEDAIRYYDRGLSPRVRGKPSSRCCSARSVRSIPACAGETCRCRALCKRRQVYPRVCGGNRVQTQGKAV